MRLRSKGTWAMWPLCVAVVFVAACGAADETQSGPGAKSSPSPSRSIEGTPGYPNSIAVLGHSGATGVNSDPQRPGEVVIANSWATGSNPAVDSVYLRILAQNPAIRGRNVNLAKGGATVDDLVGQAETAVKLSPTPDLILIQIMDNDLVCPLSEKDLTAFRSTYDRALRILANGAPKANLFVVSQVGSPTTYVKSLTAEERKAIGSAVLPCDFVNTDGVVVSAQLAALERTVDGYEAHLEQGCKQIKQCHYDDGAFSRIVDQRALSPRRTWVTSRCRVTRRWQPLPGPPLLPPASYEIERSRVRGADA